MKKYAAIFLYATVLLCACSSPPPGDEAGIPAITRSAQTDAPSSVPSATPMQEALESPKGYAPAVRAVNTLDEGVDVIAEYQCGARDSSIFLMTDEPVFDMLISLVFEDESGFTEVGSGFYLQILAADQAIMLYGPNSYPDEYLRVAYTNGDGEYEATLLTFSPSLDTPSLVFTEASCKMNCPR